MQFSPQPWGAGGIIITILQMKQLKLRGLSGQTTRMRGADPDGLTLAHSVLSRDHILDSHAGRSIQVRRVLRAIMLNPVPAPLY